MQISVCRKMEVCVTEKSRFPPANLAVISGNLKQLGLQQKEARFLEVPVDTNSGDVTACCK